MFVHQVFLECLPRSVVGIGVQWGARQRTGPALVELTFWWEKQTLKNLTHTNT